MVVGLKSVFTFTFFTKSTVLNHLWLILHNWAPLELERKPLNGRKGRERPPESGSVLTRPDYWLFGERHHSLMGSSWRPERSSRERSQGPWAAAAAAASERRAPPPTVDANKHFRTETPSTEKRRRCVYAARGTLVSFESLPFQIQKPSTDKINITIPHSYQAILAFHHMSRCKLNTFTETQAVMVFSKIHHIPSNMNIRIKIQHRDRKPLSGEPKCAAA